MRMLVKGTAAGLRLHHRGPSANIDQAIELLGQGGDIRVVCRSRNFATDPWGKLDQERECVRWGGARKLSPRELLVRCKDIEGAWGVSPRKAGPRVIDFYSAMTVTACCAEPDAPPRIPAAWGERAFVRPLMGHSAPGAGKRARAFRRRRKSGVRPLAYSANAKRRGLEPAALINRNARDRYFFFGLPSAANELR